MSGQVYEILRKESLTPVTKLFQVRAPDVARKARAGQFVIVRIDEKGERIPLTVADYDRQRGAITLVVQEVGKSTKQMGTMAPGDCFLNFVGPLGHPARIERYGTVLCVGGGSSIAAIYPLARALKEAGNIVYAIIGARTRDLIFWEDRIAAVSDTFVVCTDDGSQGREGMVIDPLKEMLEGGRAIDHAFIVGPAIMMKFCALATQPYGVPTTVSLNAIMIDGTGMCGGCRVEVGNQMRFACADGPKFAGHQVDWDQLLARQRFYQEQERQATERWDQMCQSLNCGNLDN